MIQAAARYFTGKSCSNGHVAERYISNRMCVVCVTMHSLKNRSGRLAATRSWQAANRERIAERRRNRRAELTALEMRRYATKLRATPSWSETEEIKAVYAIAGAWRQAGVDCNVDHMVPLQSNKVSGLHCLANLSILPKVGNVAKGNRWWPDMAENA